MLRKIPLRKSLGLRTGPATRRPLPGEEASQALPARRPGRPASMAEPRPATPPVLATDRLTRTFGGLIAVRDVSILLRHGELHAVIGPNGAGKTTLVNMLSADRRPDCAARTRGGGRARLAHDGPGYRPLVPAHQHLGLADSPRERAARGA